MSSGAVASTPARFRRARAKERVWGVRASFGNEERRKVLDFYRGRGEIGAPGGGNGGRWPLMAGGGHEEREVMEEGETDGIEAPLTTKTNGRGRVARS